MTRAYKMSPKFVEVAHKLDGVRYYIQFTDEGKRRQLRCRTEACHCMQKGNRYCEHKIAALQEFQDFTAKYEATRNGDNFNISVADLLDEYIAYGKAQGIHGEKTAYLVERHLNIFWNYCDINRKHHVDNWDDVTAQAYAGWLKTVKYRKQIGKGREAEAKEQGYSPTTININLRNVRALFNYALHKKYITENPFSGMGKPKQQKVIKPVVVKPKNILTKPEIDLLKGKLEGQWLRIFTVFIYTGMRMEELTKLTWNRIQPEHIWIAEEKAVGFKPKWGVERRIKIHPAVKAVLDEQKAWQKSQGIVSHFVFSTSTGNCYIQRNVDRYFRSQFKRLGIKGEFGTGLSVHSFRHTFITGMINNNMPLPTVQAIAGHKSYETTLGYFRQLQKSQDVIDSFEY